MSQDKDYDETRKDLDYLETLEAELARLKFQRDNCNANIEKTQAALAQVKEKVKDFYAPRC